MPLWLCCDTDHLPSINPIGNAGVSQTLLGNHTSAWLPCSVSQPNPRERVLPGTCPWGTLWHKAGVLRKKTVHELLTCDLNLSSFPFAKSGWCFHLGYGWLGAGGDTELVPIGFWTALEHSEFSSTALLLQIAVSWGKTLVQSTWSLWAWWKVCTNWKSNGTHQTYTCWGGSKGTYWKKQILTSTGY